MNTEQIKTELLTLATAEMDLSALRMELVRLANRLTTPSSCEPLCAALPPRKTCADSRQVRA